MNPEEKKLLDHVATLAEENNAILKGIRRSNRLGFVWKIIYWCVIIAISYGAYVYVQPYVDQIVQMYGGLKTSASNVQRTASQFSGLEKFLNNLPK